MPSVISSRNTQTMRSWIPLGHSWGFLFELPYEIDFPAAPLGIPPGFSLEIPTGMSFGLFFYLFPLWFAAKILSGIFFVFTLDFLKPFQLGFHRDLIQISPVIFFSGIPLWFCSGILFGILRWCLGCFQQWSWIGNLFDKSFCIFSIFFNLFLSSSDHPFKHSFIYSLVMGFRVSTDISLEFGIPLGNSFQEFLLLFILHGHQIFFFGLKVHRLVYSLSVFPKFQKNSKWIYNGICKTKPKGSSQK